MSRATIAQEKQVPQLPVPQQQLIETLRGKIRRVEEHRRNSDDSVFSSGSPDIDELLPSDGYQRGAIIEWLAESGSSAEYLSMMAAKQAADDGGALVIIDPHHHFYPPAARAIGINLGNLIVLRGANGLDQEDFLWSIDQSLRCTAVAAVWGELPEFMSADIATRWLRRFQLSAESSGCCGMFIRKPQQRFASNWSEIQWLIEPLESRTFFRQDPQTTNIELTNLAHDFPKTTIPASQILERQTFAAETLEKPPGDTRYIRATLSRCRHAVSGKSINLGINTITGTVRKARCGSETCHLSPKNPVSVASQLAHPKTRRRAARA